MTKCPHCDKELRVDAIATWNVDQYGNSVVSATKCCGYGVTISRVISYSVHKYNGNSTEDYWGNSFKNPTLENRRTDNLGEIALAFANEGKYNEVLKLIREQTNPVRAAWVTTFVLDNVGESNSQFKNWLANATYGGV